MKKNILTVLLLCIITSCKKDDNLGDLAPILLKSPVSIGITYNTTTNLVGDVNNFIGFAATIDAGLPTEHISPAFEYLTKLDAKVNSASYGTVSNIIYQEDSDDYEIHVTLNEIISYLIIYDHVKDLEVQVGDTLSPGDKLGISGNWGGGLGRTELQINIGNKHICPLQIGNDTFVNDHLRLLDILNTNQVTLLTEPCLENELN